jgi:hypothetical protein
MMSSVKLLTPASQLLVADPSITIPSKERRPRKGREPLTGGPYHHKELMLLLNAHFLVGNEGGRDSIFRINDDRSLTALKQDQFSLTMRNLKLVYEVETAKGIVPGEAPAGPWWLKQVDRRQQTIVFRPQNDHNHYKEFNLWNGFAVEPELGEDKMRPFMEHLREIVCQGDDTKINAVLNWLAFKVQHPELPPEVVLVLMGEKGGAGRTTVFETLRKIFGDRHTFKTSDKNLIVGSFNDVLQDKVLVGLEEALWAGDRIAGDKLKDMITAPRITLHRKYWTPWQAPNHIGFIMTTNHVHAIGVDAGDRRYFPMTVADDKIGNFEWFRTIHESLDRGGAGQLLNYLQKMECVHPRERRPQTVELNEQIVMGASPVRDWLLTSAEHDLIVGSKDHMPLNKWHSTDKLREAYVGFCKEQNLRPQSDKIVGMELKAVCGPAREPRVDDLEAISSKRTRGYEVPNGATIRERIYKRLGVPTGEVANED